MGDLVDVEPLREAFLERGEGAAAVCRRLGWIESRGIEETSRLERALGLKPQAPIYRVLPIKGEVVYRTTNRRLNYFTACKIADALGLDPFEVGL